jgi:single-strand DNA-binding protein
MVSNSVTVVGNLTREPELRYTPSGAAVVKFGLAVNRSYNNRNGEKVEETAFFDVTAWRELGENIAESLSVEKRSKVFILADEVGPSLRWATASITKTTRGGPGDWKSQGAPGEIDEEVPTGA